MHKIHQRYQLQATWTAHNRQRLYDSFNLGASSRVLEVGSGTGVITRELQAGHVYGVDIDHRAVEFAHEHDPDSGFANADGYRLPFNDGEFDLTLCHYLLLWVSEPNLILKEMKRVTRSGGESSGNCGTGLWRPRGPSCFIG